MAGISGTITIRRSPTQDPHPELAVATSVTRFWRLVNSGPVADCWIWKGDRDKHGYGVFVYQGRRYGAHELALSFTTGEKKSDGFDTCHACDTPACCNPNHLRFGSRLSNVREMHERGRAGRQGRLTDQQVHEIRTRRANGARQKDLARDYGVSESHISGIVRGKAWSAVQGPIEGVRAQYQKGA